MKKTFWSLHLNKEEYRYLCSLLLEVISSSPTPEMGAIAYDILGELGAIFSLRNENHYALDKAYSDTKKLI